MGVDQGSSLTVLVAGLIFRPGCRVVVLYVRTKSIEQVYSTKF